MPRRSRKTRFTEFVLDGRYQHAGSTSFSSSLWPIYRQLHLTIPISSSTIIPRALLRLRSDWILEEG
jgi:hypothetical protein